MRRSADCGTGPTETATEEIALALMGVGALRAGMLAEAASWDRPGGATLGRRAILAALPDQQAETIRIEQVVAHGRAGSVSGRVTRDGETALFCHVIRYTTPAATEIAQLVSFEHSGGA